jgi:hypothetical protein
MIIFCAVSSNQNDVASGLVLDRCVLIAPPLANSINAAAAQSVTCYAGKANRAAHANVIINVDPMAVGPNVV